MPWEKCAPIFAKIDAHTITICCVTAGKSEQEQNHLKDATPTLKILGEWSLNCYNCEYIRNFPQRIIFSSFRMENSEILVNFTYKL